MNEEQKYSEIIKGYTAEQLIYELAIIKKQKQNIYIKEKELETELNRRLEDK